MKPFAQIPNDTLGYTTGLSTLGAIQESAGGFNPFFKPVTAPQYVHEPIEPIEKPNLETNGGFEPIYLQDELNRQAEKNYQLNHNLPI